MRNYNKEQLNQTNSTVTIFVNDNIKNINVKYTEATLYIPNKYHCGDYVRISYTTIKNFTSTVTLILYTEVSDIVVLKLLR